MPREGSHNESPDCSYWSVEPPHDKTNKMACAASEYWDQPGHPSSLIRVFAVRMKKALVLSYPLSALRRLWSDWADTQADLSLRWAHVILLVFIHVNPPWSSGRLLKWALKFLLKHTTFYQNFKISLIWIKNFPIYSIHFWKPSLKWKENLPDALLKLITCMGFVMMRLTYCSCHCCELLSDLHLFNLPFQWNHMLKQNLQQCIKTVWR